MKIELLNNIGETVTMVETNDPAAEFEHFKSMLPEIVSWREQTEPLNEAKARYINAAKVYRDKQEVTPVTYNSNTYDYDDKARERLKVARQALEDLGTESIDWTTAAGIDVALTVADFAAINSVAATRSNTLHVAYRATKAKLEGATTIEELEQIYPLKG